MVIMHATVRGKSISSNSIEWKLTTVFFLDKTRIRARFALIELAVNSCHNGRRDEPAHLGGKMVQQNSSISTVFSDECIKLGSWKDIFLAHVVGKANTEIFENLLRYLSQFVATNENQCAYFCFVSKEAKVPDSGARQAVAEGLAQLDLVATAVVLEKAKGFWGAAALGFMSAVQSKAKQGYPLKNFGSLDDAASWFSQVTNERNGWSIRPNEISSIVNAFVEKPN